MITFHLMYFPFLLNLRWDAKKNIDLLWDLVPNLPLKVWTRNISETRDNRSRRPSKLILAILEMHEDSCTNIEMHVDSRTNIDVGCMKRRSIGGVTVSLS